MIKLVVRGKNQMRKFKAFEQAMKRELQMS